MRQIMFEPIFTAPVDRLWEMFSEVSNYPRYIKYCQKAELVGEFKVGSTWSDWSTVVWIPLKIIHKIEKVKPQKEIVYRIDLPFGGNIRQHFDLQDLGKGTKVVVRIEIGFENQLMDLLVGGLVEQRNRKMIAATIGNIQRSLNANN